MPGDFSTRIRGGTGMGSDRLPPNQLESLKSQIRCYQVKFLAWLVFSSWGAFQGFCERGAITEDSMMQQNVMHENT